MLFCNAQHLHYKGSTASQKHNVAWAEVYFHTKWHLDPSSCLATIDMGRKVGVLCPFLGRAGSPSNTMKPGPRPTSVPSGILIQPFGHNRHGPKIGGCAPFGGAGSPSSTMWPGPRPTSTPSFILIHPTVWPQYTNVTDRTTV